jgi:iron complex transport system substrate-binding protein
MKNTFTIIIVFLSLLACSDKKEPKPIKKLNKSKQLKYAKGFSIQKFNNYTRLEIYNSSQNNRSFDTYYLVPKTEEIVDDIKKKTIIRTPIDNIVVTSTTHIPMLELLGVENTLTGFPNTSYISSKKTRTLIDSKKILDLGQEQNINTELLIDLNPELVIGFGINNKSPVYKNIEKKGISVLMNNDWLEKSPLGKAEWLKFFGILYDKDSLANKRFDEIENNYLTIKKQLIHIDANPTIICGSLFQDVWFMPAGESFFAHFLADAKTDYLWKDSKGTGSLSLSIESILDKGKEAEFWIAPGLYNSKKTMTQDNPHYQEFKAFRNDKIYTYALNKGATGGVLYFELATTRPDLVLQDLVSIFHPKEFSNIKRTFFIKLGN